jgi:hydroxyacylglutathione hydrolase
MNKKYKKYKFPDIDVYRFEFFLLDSNMYFLYENESALIVDPHLSDDLILLLEEKKIKDVTVLLTHEHPDHTSGVNYIQKNYKTCIICEENCSESISEEKNNRPTLISFILSEKDKLEGTDILSKVPMYYRPYICKADIIFKEKLKYTWNKHDLIFFHTPGHSKGSVCITLDDFFVFTGDSLCENLPVITRFKGVR